jgi:large subunit ribosomal protein L29
VQLQKAVITVKTNEYIKELQNKSIEDLNKDLVSAKEELFSLRFQNATNQLENTSSLKSVRKKIARIKTVITEKAKAAQ